MKKKICKYYHTRKRKYCCYNEFTGEQTWKEREIGVCYGTKECEPCKCGGNKSECDFYKEKTKPPKAGTTPTPKI